MDIQLNMLGPSMMHRVSGEVNRPDIVAVDHRGEVNRARELLKQLAKPRTLDVGHRTILGLGLEREIVGCRLDDHEMSEDPR